MYAGSTSIGGKAADVAYKSQANFSNTILEQ
jgi:hypothetical protein